MGRVVYYVLGVIEVFLALRFVLRMLGANAQTAFVQFIYSVSAIFMAPFTAIFKTTVTEGAKLVHVCGLESASVLRLEVRR